MTCKDCIHYEVCQFHIDEETKMTVVECDNFKYKYDCTNPVRCRDCVHCQCISDEWDNDWYFCLDSANNKSVEANDYCSHGVRKEQEDIDE